MRHTLKMLPTSRAPVRAPGRDGMPRGARSTTGRYLRRPTTHSCTTGTHVREHGGRLRRWRGRIRAAIPFSAEQQFRLLQAALKIQLRSEGKPEDALTLQRPDNLPALPGTPVRRRPSRPVTPQDTSPVSVRVDAGAPIPS